MQQLVGPLFESVQQRLAAQDQDQEVKEAAISCAATVIAALGDVTDGAYLGQVKVGSMLFPKQRVHARRSQMTCPYEAQESIHCLRGTKYAQKGIISPKTTMLDTAGQWHVCRDYKVSSQELVHIARDEMMLQVSSGMPFADPAGPLEE